MGRKRSWAMEHFFLYLAAGMTLIAITTGCAGTPNHRIDGPTSLDIAREKIADANKAIASGDYTAAMQKNAEITSQYPGIIQDQVLYQLGLIYAHPQNPERDISKTIDTFRELKEKFPESNLAIEAEIWELTIEELLDKDKDIEAYKGETRKQEKTIARQNSQSAARQAQIKKLNTQISELNAQISELENQLEDLKKVDLGIQERKRTGESP
jgi:chromosome segregation ATPase